MVTKIKNSFEVENMQGQYSAVLCCRINLCFHDYKLAIEIDEIVHSVRNIDYKTKTQREIEQESGSQFIRIGSEKEDIEQMSNQLTKKSTK